MGTNLKVGDKVIFLRFSSGAIIIPKSELEDYDLDLKHYNIFGRVKFSAIQAILIDENL
jgi:hypothetical protein